MIKKQMLIKGLAIALSTSFAYAQSSGGARNQGYLLDNVGNSAVIQAPTAGVCVRTTEWTPARAIAECDPELVNTPATPKPVAVAPKPVVTAPAPKPAPPKPVVQKFSLAADTLFDFDKSVIKPAGTTKLDELVATLKGAQYDTIVTIGHTDRLGSADYNQRLSYRRAEAVRAYLVSKGLDGARISAVGKGKTQPVTKPGDCKVKARAALHACLQPDRRVDVEATGSRTVAATAPSPGKPAVKPTVAK